MTTANHDLVILGSGSTAFAAAIRAQELGAKVLMIEKSALGGTCINWGCVPSKTLIHAALFRHEARLGAACGLPSVEGEIQWDLLEKRRTEAVKTLRKTKYLDVLAAIPGLQLLRGSGRLTGPGTLEVEGEKISCDRILIATGGSPRVPELPGIHTIDFLTSRSALLLKRHPSSLIIIGGGVIALELGQMFHRLGTEVVILEHGPCILTGFEREPVDELHRALAEEGLDIRLCASVARLYPGKRGAVAVLDTGEELDAERVLLAVGTAPATTGIGLCRAGVEVDSRGFIIVDGHLRTTVPGIWAAGDVTGGTMVATVGAREGITAVDDMLNPGCGCVIDYRSIPMAVFTDPEIAMVGYTAAQAEAAGFSVITNTLPVEQVAKAHITGYLHGAVKIVADASSRRILGIHLSSHRGADIINEAALAVRFGLTIEDLAATMHVYPSMGESLRLCAQGFSRDTTRLSCCAE